jgi:antitoxin component YwqK of YwqJK toxin-antitoxin module
MSEAEKPGASSSTTGELEVEHYSNGQKGAEGRLVDGKRDGFWQTWYEDGRLRSAGNWANGAKTGHWVFCHQNGNKTEGDYKDGVRHGMWIDWWDSGVKAREVAFERDMANGVQKDWYRNGNLRQEGTYVNDQQHGEWKHWARDGRFLGSNVLEHGDGPWVGLHDNGAVRCRGSFRKSKKHGPWRFFWPDGRKMREAEYVDGRRVGQFIEWNAEGTVVTDEDYDNGKLVTARVPSKRPYHDPDDD